MHKLTIGLANKTAAIDDERLKRVAAALDVQVKRDLEPIWNVKADVVSLGKVIEIPVGVSPIMVVDRIPNDVAGIHTMTQGVPWAVVSTKRDWALAASHELIEMLVDPSGEATQNAIGVALVDGELQDTAERFDYLVEACDPIEDADHAYEIQGVRVSDFYTPSYFDDVARSGVRYSFNGALSRPREVGRNGYLSWRDPVTRKLRQLRNFGRFTIVDLPEHDRANESSRRFVDRKTPTPRTHPELFRS